MIESILLLKYFKVQHRKRKMENSDDVFARCISVLLYQTEIRITKSFYISYSMRFVCDGFMYEKVFCEWNGFGEAAPYKWEL